MGDGGRGWGVAVGGGGVEGGGGGGMEGGGKGGRPQRTLPGRAEQSVQLGGQVSADVGLGGRDGQGRGQRVRVEGGLQHHQGPVHSALVEVVRKLLLRKTREMTRT